MDNTELEFNQELKLKESIYALQDNIESLKLCLKETLEIMAIITNKEGNASKRLDKYKNLYSQLENQKFHNTKILTDYKLGLAKLERKVNSGPN